MLFNVDYHTQIAFTTLRLNYKDFNLAVDGAQISSLYGMLEDNTEKLGLYLHSLLWLLWYSQPFNSAHKLGDRLLSRF